MPSGYSSCSMCGTCEPQKHQKVVVTLMRKFFLKHEVAAAACAKRAALQGAIYRCRQRQTEWAMTGACMASSLNWTGHRHARV
jgi:hypothetical protein